MIMEKAIFIDKDGTLIRDIPFNADPGLIVLEERVIEGLEKLSDKGFLYIIITNQSGLAHGYFTEKDLAMVEAHISQLLLADEIKLNGFYYCPHYPGACVKEFDVTCYCRKPMPGLLLKAAADFNIDLAQSWVIGDILNDVEAGNRAGCRTILINNGNETNWLIDSDIRKPSFISKDMAEAADLILENILASETSYSLKEDIKH